MRRYLGDEEAESDCFVEYNVQTLPLRDMPEKFLQRGHKPWEILYSVFPYESLLAGYGFLLLAVSVLAASLGRRKFLWGALCLIISVYLAFFGFYCAA